MFTEDGKTLQWEFRVGEGNDGPVDGRPGRIPADELGGVPHTYANGFQIGVSNADISLVLKLDGEPVQVIHLSYTLAKTLEAKVGDVVARFEKAVDRKMLVTDEVDRAFKALQEEEQREAGG